MAEPKTFPMLDGPPITWAEAKEIYQMYSALFSGQSLERIAQRGGFGYSEVEYLKKATAKVESLKKGLTTPQA
jgi:hypothetical protein